MPCSIVGTIPTILALKETDVVQDGRYIPITVALKRGRGKRMSTSLRTA